MENQHVAPTLAERHAMTAVILDFVRRRRRVVYGGYSINEHIKLKDPNDAIYDMATEAPDIEFYSSDAVIDARDLCNAFKAKGYPYIRGTEALHSETYKVSVNLVQLCDITYVPKNIEAAIPFTVIDGVRYAHPHFMLIDSMRILTDPMASYWRLDKAFPRMFALQNHYPFDRPQRHSINVRRQVDPDVRAALAVAVEHLRDEDKNNNRSTIMIGYAAYDRFHAWAHDVPVPAPADVPFLEVIFTDFKASVASLFDRLATVFPRRVTYEEFQRFFDYTGRRGQLYIDGKLAVRCYHHNNRCTPVLPLRDDGVESAALRTATLSVVGLYLLISGVMCMATRPPDHQGKAICESLVFELYDMRKSFLESREHQDGILGDHPFQEFTALCVGQTIDPKRLHKEETEYRRSRPSQFGMAYFNYEPTQQRKTDQDIGNYKYMNSSGNVVRNAGDRWFNPPGATSKKGSAVE